MENKKFTIMLAKAAYFGFVWPYRKLRSIMLPVVYKKRLESAKKQAIGITRETGKACYVVFSNGRFYTLNRGAMLAMAKHYKKRTGHSVDWRKFCLFETKKQ